MTGDNVKNVGTLDVVIPVFNKEKYLKRCVDSVLAQSYAPSRIILVDDGSTDGSPDLCDELAAEHDTVEALHQKNAGASAARNTGIGATGGDFVGFIDADDWADSDMYAKLINALSAEGREKLPAAQLMNRQYSEDGTMVLYTGTDKESEYVIKTEDFYEQLIMHTGDSSMCTKVFRGDFIRRFKFSEGEKNEDFELLLRMLPEMGEGILTLDTPGYNIELSGSSVTRGNYDQSLYESMMKNAFTALRVARERYPEHISQAERFTYVQSLDFMLHIPIERMTADNSFYKRIVRYLRCEKKNIKKNRYLTKKQRDYLILLLESPVAVRKTHRMIMNLREGRKSS
ncbi:MAG: glycosyltransferase [Lachnospiraceae bacterium]|nr:glycosyltransferase [Lachnospiraceae bacterium]